MTCEEKNGVPYYVAQTQPARKNYDVIQWVVQGHCEIKLHSAVKVSGGNVFTEPPSAGGRTMRAVVSHDDATANLIYRLVVKVNAGTPEETLCMVYGDEQIPANPECLPPPTLILAVDPIPPPKVQPPPKGEPGDEDSES